MKGIRPRESRGGQSEFFNIPYGIASFSITNTSIAIATTQCSYHGFALVAGASVPATVTIYDSPSAATGSVLDRISVGSGVSTAPPRFIPVIARYGIYVVASGSLLNGSVFFGPKG